LAAAVNPHPLHPKDGASVKKSGNSRFFFTCRKFDSQDFASLSYGACARRSATAAARKRQFHSEADGPTTVHPDITTKEQAQSLVKQFVAGHPPKLLSGAEKTTQKQSPE
jgi:hypothetical protein